MKPGVWTTEFWMTLAALAGGIYLIRTGHTTEGSTLIAAAVAGYGISRGTAKIGSGGGA